MPNVGDSINAENASWSFSGPVVETFEDHVSKSIPFYNEGHDLVLKISDYFVYGESVCYEIGSSTGILSHKLAQRHQAKNTRFVGIDCIADMVKFARKNYSSTNLEFAEDNILLYEFEPSDFIVSYYVLQFIRPSYRQEFFSKVYNSLRWGGAFLFFEKVRSPDARFQDMMSALYADFKLEKGYTPEEIIGKSRSLKGVLEPFSSEANLDLLRRAGFSDFMTVFKYLCFEGFLAIK